MTGFFVAASVVTVLQFVRVRDRRLLPLTALFALLALAHGVAEPSLARGFHAGAGLSGLVLLYMLSPRHPHPPEKPGA